MPTFSYLATDRAGRPVQGTVEAINGAVAFGKLRAMGYEVQQVREATPPPKAERPREFAGGIGRRVAESVVYPAASGIPLAALSRFYRQFATLINAGMPMYQTLTTLGNQTRNAQLKRIVAEMRDKVQSGGRISEVMAAHRWAFGDLQLEMVRAAEHAGNLEDTLKRIADYLDQEIALRGMISRLTLYPKLVAVVAVLILGKAFLRGGTPAVSLLVLGSMGKGGYSLWNYLNDTVFFVAEVVLAVYLIVALCRITLFRSDPARVSWERLKRLVPGIGTVSEQFALARFGRAFAAMYSAGMPLTSGLRIAGMASGSRIVANSTEQAAKAAEYGRPLSESLREAGGFPDVVLDMLATGEQTGNVDAMMQKVAEHLEGEAEGRAYRYAHVFSITVYLIVALMIAWSVISFYTGYAGSLSGQMGGG